MGQCHVGSSFMNSLHAQQQPWRKAAQSETANSSGSSSSRASTAAIATFAAPQPIIRSRKTPAFVQCIPCWLGAAYLFMQCITYIQQTHCCAGYQEEESRAGNQGEAWPDLCACSTGHQSGHLACSLGIGKPLIALGNTFAQTGLSVH